MLRRLLTLFAFMAGFAATAAPAAVRVQPVEAVAPDRVCRAHPAAIRHAAVPPPPAFAVCAGQGIALRPGCLRPVRLGCDRARE